MSNWTSSLPTGVHSPSAGRLANLPTAGSETYKAETRLPCTQFAGRSHVVRKALTRPAEVNQFLLDMPVAASFSRTLLPAIYFSSPITLNVIRLEIQDPGSLGSHRTQAQSLPPLLGAVASQMVLSWQLSPRAINSHWALKVAVSRVARPQQLNLRARRRPHSLPHSLCTS